MKTLRTKQVPLLAMLLLLPIHSFAAAKPDFTGEWKLNTSKSDYGPIPSPTSQVQKIDHKDPVLKVVITQSAADGDTTIDATYSTDGKETKYEYRGVSMASVTTWDGDTLVIRTKSEALGATVLTVWALSADGKNLLAGTKLSTPQGDFELKSVFEKVQ